MSRGDAGEQGSGDEGGRMSGGDAGRRGVAMMRRVGAGERGREQGRGRIVSGSLRLFQKGSAAEVRRSKGGERKDRFG